ncbi:hypothetical protein CBL_12787 [Carabus blaptoides fortunei]
MSANNDHNTKAYNPSLRRRRRHNVHTTEQDYTLNNDRHHYDLVLQQPASIQCPPLTGPHREAVNKHVTNVPYNNPLVEHTDDISEAIENAVLSIVKNEPVSPRAENNDTEVDCDGQKYGDLYNGGQGLIAANNQEEVTRAARSLFSKRTRTLYNWLSPGISKSRLKASVSAAWDRLPTVEKDFYISQVLGRFGVPSVRVMVNPQIMGFSCTQTPSAGSEVTPASNNHSYIVNSMSKRKRQRVHRSPSSNTSFSITDDTVHGKDDDKVIVKQIRDEPLHDFVDDPELHQEFEQFKWTLHVSNTHE